MQLQQISLHMVKQLLHQYIIMCEKQLSTAHHTEKLAQISENAVDCLIQIISELLTFPIFLLSRRFKETRRRHTVTSNQRSPM